MIVRIVKLTFREEEIETFKQVFEDSKDKIRNFPGVLYLELLQDTKQNNVFCTYSHWNSENDLENYRHSDLFKNTWAKTKPLFKSKPEAWSSNLLHRLS
jgi:heme-degrading monooxygenase HmoA